MTRSPAYRPVTKICTSQSQFRGRCRGPRFHRPFQPSPRNPAPCIQLTDLCILSRCLQLPQECREKDRLWDLDGKVGDPKGDMYPLIIPTKYASVPVSAELPPRGQGSKGSRRCTMPRHPFGNTISRPEKLAKHQVGRGREPVKVAPELEYSGPPSSQLGTNQRLSSSGQVCKVPRSRKVGTSGPFKYIRRSGPAYR